MIAAQKKLDCKRVLVAAPRRTVLYAIDADSGKEQMDLFRKLLSHTLKDDSFGNQYISPLAFRFQDGEIIGAMIIREEENEE
jgi:hypothetical protein